MKKLQLKVKDLTNPTILSHHEIKNILGGSGDSCYCTYYQEVGGTTGWKCNGTLKDCQDVADERCSADDNCVNVDCR